MTISEIRILSAGSMRHAFPPIIGAFEKASGAQVSLTLGPAGLLRERIEAGEAFDLFASANMAHPERLAAEGIAAPAVCFARNSLCAIARVDLGMTTENFLEILADPLVKIGTSTPGDDPSGDYAFEVFARIGQSRPALGEALKSRARQLVGGRNSPPTPPGKTGGWLITDGEADLFLSYHSNARLLADDPALSIVTIPPEFSPTIEYGLALRNDTGPETEQLRDFMLSGEGQRILQQHGFQPAL
jgi:molybdate transport system substrate-binding protein